MTITPPPNREQIRRALVRELVALDRADALTTSSSFLRQVLAMALYRANRGEVVL